MHYKFTKKGLERYLIAHVSREALGLAEIDSVCELVHEIWIWPSKTAIRNGMPFVFAIRCSGFMVFSFLSSSFSVTLCCRRGCESDLAKFSLE